MPKINEKIYLPTYLLKNLFIFNICILSDR